MDLFDALTTPKRRALTWWDGSRFVETRWDDVAARAALDAGGLRGLGVEPGMALACVLTNRQPVISGMLGAWLCGAAVASLPVPARAMRPDEYADQVVALTRHVGSPFLLAEARLVEALREPVAGRLRLVAWEGLRTSMPPAATLPARDEIAFVQYSSGSTSTPKGCALTSAAIGNQLDTLADMSAAVPGEDTVASWLPLSHDMGAFGCLLFAWAHDMGLVLSSPERFVFDPRTWFGDCADHGATLSAGPSSALEVAVRAQRSGALSAPLRLRACVVGAERVSARTLRAATEVLAPHGVTDATWMPAYGLAEATLAVSAVGVSQAPSFRHLDGSALSDGTIRELEPGDPSATVVASVGQPCLGVQVALREPDPLAEVRVRSHSLASGYYGEPERTAERFADGLLATGDLGFVRDGELHIVGRGDDVLSVAGRRVYTREIEAAVDLLDAVRSGCSTIVDVEGGERSRLVMLVELRDESADPHQLAAAASRAAKAKAGVLLDECVFLPTGALPKTPSGKIQRFRCRQMLATDALDPLARVRLARRVQSRTWISPRSSR